MHVGVFFFQAAAGIRDFCLARGLGDVYMRQAIPGIGPACLKTWSNPSLTTCLLYTSDAADE